MRTIQVINVRWFNATSWYALTLARLLRDAGHKTLVLCLPDTDTHKVALQWGLPVMTLALNTTNPIRLADLVIRLRRIVADFRPDIVNCHRGEAFILWGMLRKAMNGFKLVRTRGDQRPPRDNMFNRWLHQHCDALIATNSATAKQLRGLGLPSGRIWKIYGGVDTQAFQFSPEGRQAIRQEFGFEPQHVVLGLLGRFDAVKGQKQLIDCMAMLHNDLSLTHAKLLLAGFTTATRQEEVQQWINAAGMAEHIAITGRRNDIPACISAFDVGVVASLGSEAIARAALEIMACQRPLISTRVGVMPDLVAPQALVPPADLPAMAVTLAKAITHEDFRNSLLRHQQGVLTQLTLPEFLAQTMAVYQHVLA